MGLFRREPAHAAPPDWHVRLISDYEGDGTYTLGLAESTDGLSGRSLLLMCSTEEPDEQDIAAGLGTYCLVDEVQATAYGGVLNFTVKDRELLMELTSTTATALGLKKERLRLSLNVPENQLTLLRQRASRVLLYGSPTQHPQIALDQ